jgi:hypothetical protein
MITHIVYNSVDDASNWTFGERYEAKPSFITGYVSVIDDDGAEQLIKVGSDRFKWE